ncbi:MAG TPA: hypothetical protein VK843_02125 [Planctomycetota bacterium]|nr:hypothetical protein [Planctomycetota bacterium]
MKRPVIIAVVLIAVAAELVYVTRGWWLGESPSEELLLGDLSPGQDQAPPNVQDSPLETPTQTEAPVAGTPPAEPRTEAPLTAPEWVQQILRSTPEEWEGRKKRLGWEERVALKEKIYEYFNAESKPELERRKINREWEFFAAPDRNGAMKYSFSEEDKRAIFSVVMLPNEGMYKLVLPRAQFADFYTLKDKADLLDL